MSYKKILCLLFSVVLLLTFYACGGISESSEQPLETSDTEISGTESDSSVASTSEIVISDVTEDSSKESLESSDESHGTEKQMQGYRSESEIHLEDLSLPEIEEKGFSVTDSSVTLLIGQDYIIEYEFTPIAVTKNQLVWKSSDETVATVSEEGKVSALSEGTATITATTLKGNVGKCKVTVTSQETTELGSFIYSLTQGNFEGWQFALFDIDSDGADELIVKDSFSQAEKPSVTIYNLQTKEAMLSFETGVNESWGPWSGSKAQSFCFVAYKRLINIVGARYYAVVVYNQMTTDENGNQVEKLISECIYYREEYNSGTTNYFIEDESGKMSSCTQEVYENTRTSFFAENSQIGSDFVFASGDDAEKIAKSLNG